jgi:hypothetical protein
LNARQDKMLVTAVDKNCAAQEKKHATQRVALLQISRLIKHEQMSQDAE